MFPVAATMAKAAAGRNRRPSRCRCGRAATGRCSGSGSGTAPPGPPPAARRGRWRRPEDHQHAEQAQRGSSAPDRPWPDSRPDQRRLDPRLDARSSPPWQRRRRRGRAVGRGDRRRRRPGPAPGSRPARPALLVGDAGVGQGALGDVAGGGELALPTGSNCSEQSAGSATTITGDAAWASARAGLAGPGQHVEAGEVGDQHQDHAEQHHRLAADPVRQPAEARRRAAR